MEQVKVPGRRLPIPPPDPELNRFLKVSVKHALELQPPDRGGASNIEVSGLQPTDLVELEYDNGLRQWTSVAQLLEDLRSIPTARGLSEDVLIFPPSFGSQTVSRGGMFDRVVRFFTVHVIDEVKDKATELAAEPLARAAAIKIIDTIEGKLEHKPGLYRFANPARLDEAVVGRLDVSSSKPVLLFIHGTASNSIGSFGELEGTKEWGRMLEIYEDRIYALEHRTLSVSPIQNALDALSYMPKGVKIHLVTHSRGGLVGELLCLKQLQPSQIQAFTNDVREGREDALLLEKLRGLLQDIDPQIERFVRVACPSRGTLLASNRLDHYCSAVLNLLQLLPVLHANPFYYALKATLTSLIAMKAKAEVIPGLEAQRPESPFIHLLNRPDIESAADLAVIAGNSFGGGIFQDLSAYAGGIFFRKTHDFVVNTDAMYGGLARGARGFYFDSNGDNVCHFHYFKNETTRDQLAAWLDPDRSSSTSFTKLIYRNRGLIFPSLRGDQKLPLLLVVPGLFGTELSEGGDRIWLDGRHLLPGWLDRIAMDRKIEVNELLPYRLDRLSNDLSSDYELAGFPYDWRLGLEGNVTKLEKEIETQLGKNGGRPVHLLGLGSGAMLIIGLSDKTWSALRAREGRGVLLGSPIEAALSARQMIDGKHKLVKLIALVERRSTEDIAHQLSELPGISNAAKWTKPEEMKAGLFWIGERGAEDVPEAEVRFVDSAAGNLAENTDARKAIIGYLKTGKTNQLLTQPLPLEPVVDEPVLYPIEQDLADAALSAESAPPTEQVVIRASVKHAHLVTARYPLAVGHYRGDSIVSAERALDQLLDGQLSVNFHLDLYPQNDGHAEFFDSPESKPPGALVIGLGEVGEITGEKVRRGITAATLRYALAAVRTKAQKERRIDLGISSLLLGTYGGNALTVRESVAAVVDGVAQTNLALRERNLWNHVRVDRIQFIDLYQDLALEAQEALQDLARRYRGRNGAPLLSADPYLELDSEKSGRASRPPSPYQSGWWLRLRIEEFGGSLQFTVMTDRARAEKLETSSSRSLMDDVIQDAVTSAAYQSDLSRILFELLFPRTLKDRLRDKVNLVLVLDSNTAKYPWELLAQRVGRNPEPLAKDMGLVRQFVASNPPRLRSTRAKRVLVIGNPPADPWPKLPHASTEAQEISALFKTHGYECEPLIDSSATVRRILGKVFDTENRVIHIAAHGYLRSTPTDKGEQRTGVVIGKDRFLTAAEIAQLEPVPDLVFLNCCYAGFLPPATEYAPHEMAGTIAEELIRNGVKAVVAAGWAVDDRAARLFATTFYESMLKGQNYGDAVRNARSAVYGAYPNSNTWGAYQCYGNPGFVLEVQKDGDQAPRSPQAATDAIRNIAAQARGAKEPVTSDLAKQLEVFEKNIRPEWKNGEMLAEIGFAYSELGRFEQANKIFETAFADPAARAPVAAAEQYANLQTRIAQKIDDPKQRSAELAKAEEKLDLLIRLLGKTPERLSLLGSLHKKEARWAHKKSLEAAKKADEAETREEAEPYREAHEQYDEAHKKFLCSAIQYYSEALEITADQTDFYPALNAAALMIVAGEVDKDKVRKLIDHAKRAAEAKLEREESIWSLVTIPDANLLKRILDNDLADQQEQEQIKEYRVAIRRATARERDSVFSQIIFLKKMLSERTVCDALDRIHRALKIS